MMDRKEEEEEEENLTWSNFVFCNKFLNEIVNFVMIRSTPLCSNRNNLNKGTRSDRWAMVRNARDEARMNYKREFHGLSNRQ